MSTLPATPERKAAIEPPQEQDLAPQWRKLALRAYAAIDLALDSTPREANALLVEAAMDLDATIDVLDSLAMAAEGRAA